jgi:hypothetical protein
MTFRRPSPLCAALAVGLGIAVTGASALLAPHQLAAEVRTAALRAEHGNHLLLALGAVAFVLAPIFTGAAWRTALRAVGGELGLVAACARYGVGSLVNSVTPLHLGDGLRIALFARALPRGVALRGISALGGLKLARVGVVSGVGGLAFQNVWIGTFALGCGAAAVYLACRERAMELIVLVAAATVARIGAVALVLASLHVGSPVKLACAVVPALALASIIAVTPGNLGVASAAVAMSLHAGGIGITDGVSVGIVMHAAESAAGLLVGTASAMVLGAEQLRVPRRRFVTTTSPTRRPRLVG